MLKPSRILIVLILLAAAAGGYYWWQKNQSAQTPSIISSPVTRGDVEVTVLATGILKPSRLVAVGAQVSGRITSVAVELGQTVAKGDLIAEIDSDTQENALKTAQSALAMVNAQREQAQANLTLNQQTLERNKAMLARKAVSQSEFDSAQSAVDVTKAQIAALDAQISQAEVAIRTAQVNLGYTQITAPIDGTVLSVVSQEGQTVNANQSAPTIVILGQLETMTVRAEISEADIIHVEPGQPVWFTILGDPDKRYEATLQSIEPAPESIRSDSSISTSSTSASSSTSAVYYNGIFNVPNSDGKLRTYMTAQVHVVLGRAKDVLTIPAAALGARDKNGLAAVRVLNVDGTLETRQVETGLNDKVTVEVRSGLSEGERVVTGSASAAAFPSSSSGTRQRMPPPM